MAFPEFMYRTSNKIPASQQNTPGIEGILLHRERRKSDGLLDL